MPTHDQKRPNSLTCLWGLWRCRSKPQNHLDATDSSFATEPLEIVQELFGRYGPGWIGWCPCQRQGIQTWSLPLSFSFFIRLGDCLSTYLYIYVLAVRTETPESSISRLVHQSENAKNPNKSISCMLGFIEFVGTTCFVDPYCKANLEVPQLDTVDGRNPANQLIGSFIPLFTRFFYCPAGAGFLPSTVWLTIPAEFVAFFYRYGFDVWMFATAWTISGTAWIIHVMGNSSPLRNMGNPWDILECFPRDCLRSWRSFGWDAKLNLFVATIWRPCWVWPLPSNSGKWRFTGFPYWKCNNLGGHCYWEAQTSKD